MGRNPTKEQPVRFARAVRASCGIVCAYPDCPCTGTPHDVMQAIHAWETLPDEPMESMNTNGPPVALKPGGRSRIVGATMTNTSTIGSPERPFSLDEMSAALAERKRIPYGFIVSQAIWKRLNSNVQAGAPTLVGARVALDPKLPDTEFEIAFTEKAWTDRLKTLPNGDRQP